MTDWRQSAACADVDMELFFPVTFVGPGAVQAEAAKAVCRECPVRVECLEDAIEQGDRWAVRGGLTPAERGETVPELAPW